MSMTIFLVARPSVPVAGKVNTAALPGGVLDAAAIERQRGGRGIVQVLVFCPAATTY